MKIQICNTLALFGIVLCQTGRVSSATWVNLNSGITKNLYGVQFLDANNGFVCGDSGAVLKTANGGSSWTAINIPTTFPVRQISFVNSTTGYAAVGDPSNYTSSGGIFSTTNGGVTWTSLSWMASPFANLSVQFFNSTTGYVGSTHYTSGTGTDCYFTSNSGASWTPNPSSIDWNWIYDMSWQNVNQGWMVGNNQTNGSIFYTNNAGGSWSTQNSTSTFYYGIDFPNSNVGFVSGAGGIILASTNGGTSWANQISGTTQQLNGISFGNVATGWAAGNAGTIVMTMNGGTNWGAEVSGTTVNLNAITALDSLTAWAVGNGGVIIKRELSNGISEKGSDTRFSLYPNPMTDFTSVFFSKSNSIPIINVFDVQGKSVIAEFGIEIKAAGENIEIKLARNQMPEGIYFLQVWDENHLLGVKKLLISK